MTGLDDSPGGGDRFGGAWLVTEYVFDPDGAYRGSVAQRRRVEPAGESRRFRVAQSCRPSPELHGHPMAGFAGDWVFDMEVDGAERRYLGPDVLGAGAEWNPGAMTGRGVWPRFGYEFESYSVLVAPDRQLTCGFFSLAGRSVADIVGVAVPESAGIEPRLDLSAPVPEVEGGWPQRRSVGPLLVAADQPSALRRRRLWAMRDPIGASGFSLIEDAGAAGRSVSVAVG
ncbi:MAG: hypothetical protein OXC00_05165 [Acidimicrobiaceae bacterium]|nr:hypothetical protein [Acidimicrobiaceae bacterium]